MVSNSMELDSAGEGGIMPAIFGMLLFAAAMFSYQWLAGKDFRPRNRIIRFLWFAFDLDPLDSDPIYPHER